MSKPCAPSAAIGTRLAHHGRPAAGERVMVNPAVHRASTILFDQLDDFESCYHDRDSVEHRLLTYGRFGTPSTYALEDAVATLEGAAGVVTFPSGLSAVASCLLAFASAGDHVLIVDSVYGPTRQYAERTLKRLGIAVDYYDPRAEIAPQIRANTKLIFAESPGSLTFEIQDIPALVAQARDRGIKVALDNTWATPIFFPALEHGVDLSISSATKYYGGHADIMLGTVASKDRADDRRLREHARGLGLCSAADTDFLALRGLRSLHVRLKRHEETALALARFLEGRREVVRVLHPALESHPDHALWRRDFRGSSGLFSFILDPRYDRAALRALVENRRYFGIGSSWGSFESLMIPGRVKELRTAVAWQEAGTVVRVYAGLEDAGDLIADLEEGLAQMAAVG